MFKKVIAVAAVAGVIGLMGACHNEVEAAPMPVQPVASPQENNAAMDTFTRSVGVGGTVGMLVGTGTGLVAGCVLGTIVTLPTVIGVPVGCVGGAAALGALGGTIGTVLGGGGTAIPAGIDLFGTLSAAPGTTKYAQ